NNSPQPLKEETQARDFNQMQEFLQQENERVKAIKILNLDLEHANLELKKKEIEVKLAELNKTGVAVNLSSNPGSPSMGVSGIFVSGTDRWALMNIDGVRVQVKPGQAMRDGMVIKEINADAVIVRHRDARKETIYVQ
ncbi:MAG: hypothetical protein HY591_07130, partial [Candidatus Omnitrophica bacterium]|nr:hypothetical protein [Candidatus Omnitrophota bacterium]